MRCLVVSGLLALALVSCKKSEEPNVQPEAAEVEPAPPSTSPLDFQGQRGADVEPNPISTRAPERPTAVSERVPTSPFLVPAAPTQQPTAEVFQAAPPPPPSPQPLPRPSPASGGWSGSTNTSGKPCPVGRCLLDGKCIIPGGPIAHDGAPPGAVFGACGGDGGTCSRCRCVSTGTALSTPTGEVPIEELRTGDVIWSTHEGRVQAVRLLATQRVRVQNHSMAHIRFRDGFVVEISGEHPLGDGRSLWNLNPGEIIGTAQIEALSVVPYAGNFTFDVLPDSDSGTYYIHGMWVGSTMFGQRVRGDIAGPER
ncbi:MAG TPA: Hint domain-containing protein [Polyangium sp.]|nr:Hint domain-containing protein [Polyangium sp.]